MTPAQKTLARHALGLPNGRKRSYRNRYFTSGTNKERQAMIKAGEADGVIEIREPRSMYWLTVKGAKAALEPGETLCPEDFPEAA